MPETVFERPQIGLADSYRSLIKEFEENGEELVPFPLTFPNEDFEAFLKRLEASSRGEGIPEGWVPHTTYWLVQDGVVVAVSNLRHSLTDALRREGGHIGYGVRPSARRRGLATEILKRTLGEARELGLNEVLITCGSTNAGSIRAILNNGGEFLSEEFLPERGEIVKRYRINLGTDTT
ncbi:MAG: GNAT family N-acetyltransferase [Actinobacteria bacterium]|nr:GNAT family N-acetyltransferase [Actinomycetota bacterium]